MISQSQFVALAGSAHPIYIRLKLPNAWLWKAKCEPMKLAMK